MKQKTKQNFKHQKTQQKGFIALVTTLIVSAVAGILSVGFLNVGITSAQTTVTIEGSKRAKAFADACAEEGLMQIRTQNNYTGTGTLTFTDGSCTYIVTNDGQQNRTITSTGVSINNTRKLRVQIDAINPQLRITYWQEIP